MNRHDATAPRDERVEPPSDLDALAEKVLDAAFCVHRELGPGYLESVYEEALALELRDRHIEHARQPAISIAYKGRSVGSCRLDFLIEDRLVVELKAVDAILEIHKAQMISYLRGCGLSLGLLINFNVPLLKHGIKRLVMSVPPWRRGAVAVQSIGKTHGE